MERDIEALRKKNFDKNCSFYGLYYRFIDPKFYSERLLEISPNFRNTADKVSANFKRLDSSVMDKRDLINSCVLFL